MCTYHRSTQLFVHQTPGLMIFAVILSLSTVITLCCCEGVRRTSPTNLIVLALFTVAEAYLVGFATIRYDHEVVSIAFEHSQLFACRPTVI